MRALRVLGLLVVVAATGLLSGGAAGAAPTAAAAVTAAIEALPAPLKPGALLPGGGLAVAAPAAPPAEATVPAAPPVAEPVVEAPVVEAPVVEEPVVEAPVVEAPVVEAPVVEEPVVEAPRPPRIVDGTPCRSTARACVELSSNQAWLIRDGEVSYGPVPITHGRSGFRTPPGTFNVTFRNRDHVSSIYDAPMPYSVFFNGGIAFHQGSLQQLSHGCIHLSRTAAVEFFDSLRQGDVVQVVT